MSGVVWGKDWRLHQISTYHNKILISVVVGALLLAGLYLLFEDTILPTLTQRIEDLFDYKG